MLDSDFSTLVELLRWRALHQPDRIGYTYLVDGESDEIHLTYGNLDQRARAIGAELQSLGAARKRVLLLYPPGLDYIAGFFGCLYAEAVAVPLYPPRPNRTILRLQSITANAQPSAILTTVPISRRMEPLLAQCSGLKKLLWLATDTLDNDSAQEWKEPSITSNALALLQYTSGSTEEPKGVMVSHGNLLHNERMIQQAFAHTEQSTVLGWLPLYHDMGLIGNVLQPLYVGARCVLMAPEAFLLRPLRWLQAIARYKAHTSGGPNFAYKLCVRKITEEQRATLDLSSWHLAFNGAEPIYAQDLNEFATTFEPYGFRREAFYPCYGLAEATLMVSGGLKSALPVVYKAQAIPLQAKRVVEHSSDGEEVRSLIGCGRTLADQKIVIVDPESRTKCRSNEVGEIWVSGPSVALGYWNRPEETDQTYRAYLADTGEGPFLRTGDLGFLRDAELFVTGRLKDMIIISGHNHYPHDIERTVEQSHPSLLAGGCAAFSVESNSQERLVVAAEIDHRFFVAQSGRERRGSPAKTSLPLNTRELVQTIRQAVTEHHDVRADRVLLLKPASLPKTTSGKIQRYACRDRFLSGDLEVLNEVES